MGGVRGTDFTSWNVEDDNSTSVDGYFRNWDESCNRYFKDEKENYDTPVIWSCTTTTVSNSFASSVVEVGRHLILGNDPDMKLGAAHLRMQ
jgi:hypothetical protein